MITNVTLKNFKCFQNDSIPLGRLTLLTGVNGAGKSSVIQALLMLRQISIWDALVSEEISLAGELVDIGRASDILFSGAEEDTIGISASFTHDSRLDVELEVDLSSGDARWQNMEAARDMIADMAAGHVALFAGGLLGNDWVAGFNYLNAERYGPRKSLPIDGRRGRVFDLGRHGEYVFDGILQHQDRIVLDQKDPRKLEHALGDRLRDQLEVWLHEISPGVQLRVEGLPRADVAMGSYSFGHENKLRSPEYRATNVGFGLSYILPVIAALLAAPAGGLVIIENPEAHLHPNGQTKIGELCARAAAAGVQVIIETHSDHVMDGARLAVRDGTLSKESSLFHYFRQADGRAVRTTPVIDAEGKLSEWPEGFFDQHRKNAARLARPRRS